MFVCLCMRSMFFFPFGLVFLCSWNGSKCIGVFAIAVRIIIIVINTIIIVAIYIQGTLLVEVDFVIITCRSWNTFPMPCQGFIWFLLLPKHRIKACNLPPNRTALPCAAVWHLRVTYSFTRNFSFLFRVGRLDSHRTKVFCAVSAGSVRSCLISGKVEGKNAPSQIKTRDTDYCILHAWLPYSRLEVYERKCEFRNIARVLLHVLCFWYDFFMIFSFKTGLVMNKKTIQFPWGCDWLQLFSLTLVHFLGSFWPQMTIAEIK